MPVERSGRPDAAFLKSTKPPAPPMPLPAMWEKVASAAAAAAAEYRRRRRYTWSGWLRVDFYDPPLAWWCLPSFGPAAERGCLGFQHHTAGGRRRRSCTWTANSGSRVAGAVAQWARAPPAPPRCACCSEFRHHRPCFTGDYDAGGQLVHQGCCAATDVEYREAPPPPLWQCTEVRTAAATCRSPGGRQPHAEPAGARAPPAGTTRLIDSGSLEPERCS